MSEPIPVPQATANIINAILQRRSTIDVELQQSVALVLATIGAPNDWQLHVNADGSMVAVDSNQQSAAQV